MDEVFEAPALVKDALVRNAKLNSQAVGTEVTKKYIKELLAHPELKFFLVPDTSYSKTRSRYGRREFSTRVDPLAKQAKVFSGGEFLLDGDLYVVNIQEKGKLQQELMATEEDITEADKNLRQLQETEKNLQHEQTKLNSDRVCVNIITNEARRHCNRTSKRKWHCKTKYGTEKLNWWIWKKRKTQLQSKRRFRRN